MRVAVDCDGVLYEWDKTARYMMRRYRGYEGNDALHQESISWDWIQENVDKEDWKWLWTEGVEKGLFRYGHLVKDAVWGLQSLVKNDFDVVLVTHRPEHAVPDTLAWLSLLDVDWAGIHILSDGAPKTSVSASILVDDKPENIVNWALEKRHAILFDRKWNERWHAAYNKYCYRAYGWTAVVALADAIRNEEEAERGLA